MKQLINYIIKHTERTRGKDAGTVKEGENVTVFTLDAVKTKEITDRKTVDVHFFKVALVNSPKKEELEQLIKDEFPDLNCLKKGPNYIQLGGLFGDQEIALRFLALGELLELWSVITPEKMGLPADLAGQGFIMCSGYSA